MADAIAITGASGWLGLRLVRAALAAGWKVQGIVRSAPGARSVESLGGRAEIVADLDPAGVAGAAVGCSALVHLAGISAEREAATYEAVNVEGARRAAEGARRARVPRIVYLSGLGVARYGFARRSTNPYFLAKLAAEVELFRSGLAVSVFRPSYIVGPEDEMTPALLAEMERGGVEIVGRGLYRLQPVAVRDACDAMLRASAGTVGGHRVVDLVGPEVVTYRAFVERVGEIARAAGRAGTFVVRDVSLEEAEARAAAGGYRGLLSDELDVLLCDEIADAAPLEGLLGRPLTSLDDTIRVAIEGSRARPTAAFRR